jgi:hypothetical protein
VEELLIWFPSTKAGVESLEGNPNGRQVGDYYLQYEGLLAAPIHNQDIRHFQTNQRKF